jgi:hypothetical protein
MGRIADDDFVASLRLGAQCSADELVDPPEVVFSTPRPGEYKREGEVGIVRVEQDAKDVKNLFGRTRTTGEDDNAVPGADKRFKAFFDIGKDDQVVDDGVR